MSIEMTRVEWFTDSKMHEGTFENYQHQCSMFFLVFVTIVLPSKTGYNFTQEFEIVSVTIAYLQL